MSFRIQPAIKGVYLLFLLALLGMGVWLNPIPLFKSDSIEMALGQFFGILSLVSFLSALWVGIVLHGLQKATLKMTDEYIELISMNGLHFLLPSWLIPFRLEYEKIDFVGTGRQLSTWELSIAEEKAVNLPQSIYGEKSAETILNELRKHIPPNRMENGLGIFKAKNQKKFKSWVTSIILFILALLISAFLNEHYSLRSTLNNAWKVEMRSSDTYWAFSAETSNDLWGVTSDSGRLYRIVNKNGTAIKKWDSPRLALNDSPIYVTGDKTGEPILWFGDRVLHYTGGNWDVVHYRDSVEAGFWLEGVVDKEQGWFISRIGDSRKLINTNALTGEWREIPLPEDAFRLGFSPRNIKRAYDGSYIVLLMNDIDARVYILSANSWQARKYPIIFSKSQEIRDYFLDEKDVLWALVGEDFGGQIVERISQAGEVKLTFLPAPADDDDMEFYGYRSLIVDSQERLWVAGYSPFFITVFSPKWNEEAVNMEMYTRQNSNLRGYGISSLDYFPDRLIVSGENYVSSTNTGVEVLPSPLPDWFARIDVSIVRMCAWIFYTFLLFQTSRLHQNPNYGKTKKTLPSPERISP